MITRRDIGFAVRIVNRTDEWNGRDGVLLGGPEEDGRWPVRLDGVDSRHGRHWFFPNEIHRRRLSGPQPLCPHGCGNEIHNAVCVPAQSEDK